MCFLGNNYGFKKWSDQRKLEYDLKLHKELSEMYELVTKLVVIAYKRNIKMIIENPYSSQHYLTRYWPIKPKLIDMDRTERGDYYKKPTQYWFINREPSNNLILEYIEKPSEIKKIVDVHNKAERSMISTTYANRFIREFIL